MFVLVVDDNADNFMLIKRVLGRLGRVGQFCPAELATACYLNKMSIGRLFEFCVIDLNTPKKSGYEVAAEILAIDPRAKLILSSSSKEDPVVRNFKDYGFIGVIYDFEQLKDYV